MKEINKGTGKKSVKERKTYGKKDIQQWNEGKSEDKKKENNDIIRNVIFNICENGLVSECSFLGYFPSCD